jgi:hypothetical protein
VLRNCYNQTMLYYDKCLKLVQSIMGATLIFRPL